MKPLRAIIVEDSPDDTLLLVRELKRSFDVSHVRVQSEDELRKALQSGGWDIVLSDYTMPKFDGLHAFQITREEDPSLPFVIVSGTMGEQKAVEAMRQGVNDYLLKEELGRLAPAVERELRERDERQQAALALETSDARLEALLEQLPVVVWTTDLDLRFTSSVGAGLERLGLSPTQVAGATLEDYFQVDDPEFPPYVAHQRALRGESYSYESRWGGRVYECTVHPLRDSFGKVAGTVGAALDVTGQRELQAQLRASQRMEAIGRLAGGVAHDMNNALSVIESYAALLQEEVQSAQGTEDLGVIREAVQRAASLVRQLLAFSRRQVMQAVVLDLNEVVRELEKMLRRVLGERIELESRLEEELELVVADRAHIEQVIMNLVVNSRDAMPDGGKLKLETGNVTLDAARAEQVGLEPGPYVLLAVSDTGTGMDAQTRNRAFEPFFTTKEEGQGTGLGLSTAYGIVAQSGGSIRVESEPNQGTRVAIYLPRGEAQPEDEEQPGAGAAAPAPAAAETVLLTEDEPAVRRAAARILRREGYQVLEAGDAEEALSVASAHDGPLHLLITDAVMPVGSGPELAERLAEARGRIGVLFVSGYADGGLFPNGGPPEGSDFLPKPFSPDELLRKVRQLLEGRAQA